jgi:ribosomal protein S6
MQEKKNKDKNTLSDEISMDIDETNLGNSRIYEVGYLFVPTISEEELPVNYGNLKELISSYDGQIITDEMPKIINLAYPMTKVIANIRNKFTTGYFGWVKFEMDSQQVLELKKKLDLNPNLIRFLIIKTVKENTIAAKRFVYRDSVHRKAPIKIGEEISTENKEINKEEIDKEIDAMVAI